MTCDECRNLLQDLVDDEVGPAERAALEAHLGGCPACAQRRRELAKFTTGVAQAVRPLRPAADFSSKVIARYEGTQAELRAAAAPARSYPVWPVAVGIAVLVLAGALLLAWPRGAAVLGTIRQGRESARVLSYTDGAWREVQGPGPLRSGERVEALPPAGTVVVLDLKPWGEALLRAPCGVQLERQAGTLVLRLLPEAPGRVRIVTDASPARPSDARAFRVALDRAWVEVPCAERNAVDVEPQPGGQLSAAVQRGSARLGNVGEPQAVAEGYSRAAPQDGACSPAAEVQASAFEWAGER